MKLDRTAHKAYNFKDQKSEIEKYIGFSLNERIRVFNYLQSVAYNFDLNNHPKMDKSVHSSRKHG